jgi:ABC-type antimicrobial peptide transport system permease subunit
VGVLHDTLNRGLTEPAMPEVYLPFTLAGAANLLVVRTQPDPATLTRSVVSQVYAIDRSQPVSNAETMEKILEDEEYATPRFSLVLLSIFGVIGLALAGVGVYGVMSSIVAQRRHEIGVRMALGAASSSIVRMVIVSGSRLLLAGIALGLIGSVAAARLLAGQIWNISAFDPLAFGVVSAILLIAGLQACLWPALRAGRVDPLTALRQD